jgi:hypothetical protein
MAQGDQMDSLKKLLPTLRDSARLDCLHALGVWCLCKRIDSAAYYTNQLYDESKKLNNAHGLAVAYNQKAIIASRSNNLPLAEQMAMQSLSWYGRTDDKRDIEYAYEQAAAALFFQFKEEQASGYFDDWYHWAQKNRNVDQMYGVFGFQYENYRDRGEYDKAFEAFEKNQRLTDSLTGKKDLWNENYVLAELQRRLGNYAIALQHYRVVIDSLGDINKANIWFRLSFPELFALNGQFDSAQHYYNLIDSSKLDDHDRRFYLVSIGEFYLLQKKYDQALNPLLRGLQGHRQARDSNYVKRALIGVAKAYAGLGQDANALAYARQALNLSIRSHAKQYMMEGFQILYELYQRRNQSDSAFTYYQKYVTQKEIVANDVVKGRFAAYNYQQQIALLDKEKIVQKQKLQKEKTNRNILIGAFAIGLLMAGFIIRNIQLKRRKDKLQHLMTEATTQLENRRKEQLLAEIQQQKTELEMQALRAQMNPHFIFNSLSSINMFILENNKLQASEYLSKFSKLMRLILQNSQEAFIPLERELEALRLYLELECVRFDKKFEYSIAVDGTVDTTVLRVPPLIIQPYVENAIWHGLMHKQLQGHLEIELFQEDDVLRCKITDDGVGRAEAEQLKARTQNKHKSMGIKITETRIAMTQINPSAKSVQIRDLVYADGSAAGTEVILTIPTYTTLT